ncbi:hypothetical protein JL721_3100 [Aureococcus anophagefferens]|nr:hypothetical protein JL721_3100 [Aureococcus anophagefferens]
MADDDERDAKNPIVEEPKSHSKGAWTLEEAIVDIDALIAAQAERRQFVAPKINYAGRCGAIIIGLLIPLIIFAVAFLSADADYVAEPGYEEERHGPDDLFDDACYSPALGEQWSRIDAPWLDDYVADARGAARRRPGTGAATAPPSLTPAPSAPPSPAPTTPAPTTPAPTPAPSTAGLTSAFQPKRPRAASARATAPSAGPTAAPTAGPTAAPTSAPTSVPSSAPSLAPTYATVPPTRRAAASTRRATTAPATRRGASPTAPTRASACIGRPWSGTTAAARVTARPRARRSPPCPARPPLLDYWLSLFVSSGAVYGGLCQGDEGTAQTDWDAVDTMSQRIFGYVGAHHGRMGKLGIGRKGKVSHECGWLWSNGRRGMDLDFGGRKSYYRKQHKAENSDKRPSGEHKEVANGQCIIYGTGCQRFSRPGEGEDADAVFFFSPKNSMAVVSPCRKQRNCLCEYPARTSEAYEDWWDDEFPGDRGGAVFSSLWLVVCLLLPVGLACTTEVQNLQHYDDTGRLTGKERLRRFWQLAVKFAYGGALTGLAVARPYATACRAALRADELPLLRVGIARANNKTHLAAIHARAKIFNVVDVIATVIVAVVGFCLALAEAIISQWRVPNMDQAGCWLQISYAVYVVAEVIVMSGDNEKRQRQEVKAMVRVFDLFFDEINRQENGSYRFLHVGGLSAAETEALAAFHESTGAYLAHDVAWARKHAEQLKQSYYETCRAHKHLYFETHQRIQEDERAIYNRVVKDTLEKMVCCDVTDADTPDVVMDQRIEIVRVKNRFIEPTSGGWADAMINFRFVSSDKRWTHGAGDVGHLCELQLIHNDMLMVRKDWGAHESYSIFRTSIQLLEAAGKEYFKLVTEIDALTASELEKKRHLVSKKEEDVDAALEPLRLELDAWMEEVDPDNEHHIASHDGVALSHDAQKIRAELKKRHHGLQSRLDRVEEDATRRVDAARSEEREKSSTLIREERAALDRVKGELADRVRDDLDALQARQASPDRPGGGPPDNKKKKQGGCAIS